MKLRLSRSAAPAVVTAAFGALLVGSNVPTPLYGVYRERFGFSPVVLTLIFAAYALTLVPTLLLLGQASDVLGRRRVVAGGLAMAVVGLLLFACASGVAWLVAARVAQGVAVGSVAGAAAAWLAEAQPPGHEERGALLTTVANAGGCAVGPLLAGALAQWAPAPRVLVYVLWAGVTVACALAVLTLPDSGPARGGRLRFERPSVPAPIRAAFARASLTGTTVWMVAALFLSVVPSYAEELLATRDLAAVAAIVAVMLACSALAQVVLRRVPASVGQPLGLGLLIAGLAALVGAFPAHALWLLLLAAVLAGTGHGLGFHGAQAQLNRIAPDERRGALSGAFYACIYLGVGVSAIGVGLLATATSLETAVDVFAAAVGALALATAAWQLRAAT